MIVSSGFFFCVCGVRKERRRNEADKALGNACSPTNFPGNGIGMNADRNSSDSRPGSERPRDCGEDISQKDLGCFGNRARERGCGGV